MSIRIGVNLRQYAANRIGGLENYLRNVLPALAHHQLDVWLPEDQKTHVAAFLPTANLIGVAQDDAPSLLRQALKDNPPDVYFCPLLVLEPLVPPCPSAVLIPDLQHEFFPDFFPPDILSWRRANYAASARNADVVFTLSAHAKQTLVDRLGADPDKVTVVGLDVDPEHRQPPTAAAREAFLRLRLPEPYVYFPANFWPHKNHAGVLEALRLLDTQGFPGLTLVLSGAPETGADGVLALAARLGLDGKVRMVGHLLRPVQAEVFRHARALFFPTLFEGFGIPVLEAFHAGIPVVASSGGSCEEIAAGAALLVDPTDPASMAHGLRQVLSGEPLRQDLIARGSRRADLFSWAEAARRTEQALLAAASPAFQPLVTSIREWPRIGIVTPSFQMAPFLEQTIESVLAQRYPHFEFLVMDAGSTDGTLDILRKFEHRIRWRSEPDRGQADAINKGFRQLDTPVFAYLNADDTYLPGALETVAAAFRDKPNSGLVYGQAWHVDASGARLEPYATEPFDLEALPSRCFICQPAAFVSRQAFAEAGLMDPDLHFALDYDLWIRIGRQFHTVFLDSFLATSRMHRANKTLSSRRQVYSEIFSVTRKHFGYVPHSWIQGYACHLLDGKDQFFDRSRPSIASHLLSLLHGFHLNPGRRRQFFADWKRGCGIGVDFTGRWDDGWISRRYTSRRRIGEQDSHIRVEGRHNAPIRRLSLQLEVDGQPVAGHILTRPGPFRLVAALPPSSRGKLCELVISAGSTWRPLRGGDYRRLSCIIDAVELDAGDAPA